jgi:hypothetical protein
MSAQCNPDICFLRHFQLNKFNLVPLNLQIVDSTKGRGVFATRDIPKNTLICLFPGEMVYRYPEKGLLPREEWDGRDRTDETKIDSVAYLLPLSDYSITVGCLHVDPKSGEETGYYYRILDPMANDPDRRGDLDSLWAQLRDLQYWFSDEVQPIPDSTVEIINARAELFYMKLASSVRTLRNLPVRDPKIYEFFVDTSFTEPRIMLWCNGKLHFVIEKRHYRDQAWALENIRLALNSEFDVKDSKKRQLADRAKALKIGDDYPYVGAFINQPYTSAGEKANSIFIDPHEWVGK